MGHKYYKPKQKIIFNASYKILADNVDPMTQELNGVMASCANGNIVSLHQIEMNEFISHGESNLAYYDDLQKLHVVYYSNCEKLRNFPKEGIKSYPDLITKFQKAQAFNLSTLQILLEYQTRLYEDYNIYSVIEEIGDIDPIFGPMGTEHDFIAFLHPNDKVIYDYYKSLNPNHDYRHDNLLPFINYQYTTQEDFSKSGKTLDSLSQKNFRFTITSAIPTNTFHIPDFITRFKYKGQNEIIKLIGGKNLIEIPYDIDLSDNYSIKQYNISDITTRGVPDIDKGW